MAAIGEGNARALCVGQQWYGGDDPFGVDHYGLIVRLRKLHECHVRFSLLGAELTVQLAVPDEVIEWRNVRYWHRADISISASLWNARLGGQ